MDGPRRLVRCSLVLLVALAGGTPAASAAGPELDRAIVAELNLARTDPAAYAQTLKAYRALYRGKIVEEPKRSPKVLTHEGVAAVDEAIAFLRAAAPEGPLEENAVLDEAAADHVRDQGPTGELGHYGTDGSNPGVRIERHGQWAGTAAEDISYGFDEARDVVRQLIIDDGVPDRGHRVNIFNPRLRFVGVACGPHRAYRHMCVIDFASAVRPR